MKSTIKLFLLTLVAVFGLATVSLAQDCRAKTITLEKGAATLSGKTGGCVKYRFVIDPGTKAVVTLRSSDNKARFDLQDGAEDETGSTLYEDQTGLDKVLEFDEFTIEVKGTASVSFTLTIKAGG